MSYDSVPGPTCCSKQWIGVHYINPWLMYMLDDLESTKCVSDPEQWPHLEWTQQSTL